VHGNTCRKSSIILQPALIFTRTPLRNASAANQLKNQNDQGNDEQKMDETAAHVANKSKQPQDQQDYKNGPKHMGMGLLIKSEFPCRLRASIAKAAKIAAPAKKSFKP
jgi:hypothetical protein